MKVYIVTEFKKDKATGYNLPCSMEVYLSREEAEQVAGKSEHFTKVTTKEVHGS